MIAMELATLHSLILYVGDCPTMTLRTDSNYNCNRFGCAEIVA
jgi:hypothetical protein